MPIVATPTAFPPSDPTDSTSPDGHIRAVVDPLYGGVKLLVDYTLYDPTLPQPLANPFACTLYRETPDGEITTVRGGNPYANYAGKGRLYDQEGPLDTLTTYWAVPMLADGTDGPPCAGVQVRTSSPYPGMWLVSPTQPGSSILSYSSSSRDGTYAGNSDLQKVLDSPYPAVTLEVGSSLTQTMTLYTFTQAQAVAAKALFDQRIFFRKATSWEQPDGWFVIQDVQRAAAVSVKGQGCLMWTLSLTEIERPATDGQFVSIPGATFRDRLAQYAKFSNVITRQFSGNLLLEAESGFETGVTWSAANGNTTVSQDLANFRDGIASMKLVATAAGSVGSIPPYNVPVIPGQQYEFTAWCFTPNGGRTVNFEVDWKDAANTYLGFVASTPLPLASLQWTKVKFSCTVPTGAYDATLLVLGSATHAADSFNFDVVSFGPKP